MSAYFGKGSFCEKQPHFAALAAAVRTPHDHMCSDAVKILLSAAAIAVLCALMVILMSSGRGDRLSVRVGDDPAYRSMVGAPAGRRQYLTRASIEAQRKFAGKVHYVAELIKSVAGRGEPTKQLAHTIVAVSSEMNYDPFLVAAVIKWESTFKHKAFSPVGAVGLMQLMPATAEYIARKQQLAWNGSGALLDPRHNIRLGIEYLKYLEKTFSGNLQHVLVAYNWGPDKLRGALQKGRNFPASTVRYAKAVLDDKEKWSREYSRHPGQFEYLELGPVA